MKTLFLFLTSFFIFASSAEASLNSDAENILNQSTFVDSTHPVRVLFSGDCKQVAVSLFAAHAARDQDCKITALLIMKELSRHYPVLQYSKISFFDDVAQTNLRTVSVNKAQISTIDAGAKVQSVLAKLELIHQSARDKAAKQQKTTVQVQAAPHYAWSNRNIYGQIQARGATILAQTTVPISGRDAQWTPTGLTVKHGQVIWIDTKDDIIATSAKMVNAETPNSSQLQIVIMGKLTGTTKNPIPFDCSKSPLFAPADGMLFLSIDHTQIGKQDCPTRYARILVSN